MDKVIRNKTRVIENPTLVDYFEGRCSLNYLQINAKVFKLQDGTMGTQEDWADELLFNNYFKKYKWTK